jgi:hypothetical protein
MAERRPARDWALAAEAGFWLVAAGAALRTLPFSRLVDLAARPPHRRQACVADAVKAKAIGRAVEAAARRAPWPVRCFEMGLAAQAMLRLRGRPSVLYYGGRNDAARGLTAHVWVETNGLNVVGGGQATGFGVLAAFPSPEPAGREGA